MYNVPSFTLARAVGGLFAWYWVHLAQRAQTPLIILASVCIRPSTPYKAILTLTQGFILGEGFLSIVNLFLQGLGVPHL
jgi:uncharacterized oligopeptide transporter (OPT) family protein